MLLKRISLLITLVLALTAPILAQRIKVNGSRFEVNGHRIWLNAVNTPWNNWNDFGGNYNSGWWDAEFGRIRSFGGNATRIWITCNGDGPIQIAADGIVTGLSTKFWTDVDDLMGLAQKHKLYVMATLISFDHTKTTNRHSDRFRKMYDTEAGIQSFVDNYVIPFVDRYKNNPYLAMIEPCNEIEWIWQNDDNAKLPLARLQKFVGKAVQAVNTRSEILSTLGVSAKWQGGEVNEFTDAKLQAQVSGQGVFLHVPSPHWYDWVRQWFGCPFTDRTPASYGLGDKPAIIGEVGANSSYVVYQNAFNNGWQGAFAWTSNGVDVHGSLSSGLGTKLQDFYNANKSLIDIPLGEQTPTTSRKAFPNATTCRVAASVNRDRSMLTFRSAPDQHIHAEGFSLDGTHLFSFSGLSQDGTVSIPLPQGAPRIVVVRGKLGGREIMVRAVR